MKKIRFLLLLIPVLLCGCTPKKQVYQVVYLDVFDTVTTLRGYAQSQAEFYETADRVHSELMEYHRLFDIYHDFPGGIKAVNDGAGGSPVPVDAKVMALLKDCKAYYDLTGGRVNFAMGSVLHLWHEARETGSTDHPTLPDPASLCSAAEHISPDSVILDEAKSTVWLADPEQSLDVGAIAKGWAAQQVSQALPGGYLLNLGGNICAAGSKPDGSSWIIGIQDPDDASRNLCTVGIAATSVVTSGDYQRCYTVDGKTYHHIIDPDTLMPSEYWRSVTILCPDSGLADCLSTALFLLPAEEGQALVKACGAEAMWVDSSGILFRTQGFQDALQ